jgi:hypothetical protein
MPLYKEYNVDNSIYNDMNDMILSRMTGRSGNNGETDKGGAMRKFFKWAMALPDWLRADRADFEQAHRRRESAHYRARKRRVKTLWIVAGLTMVLNPEVYFVALVALITTFLSFGILDNNS